MAAGLEPGFVFVIDPVVSADTYEKVLAKVGGRQVEFVFVDDSNGPPIGVERNWGKVPDRIQRIAELRNLMLGAVRQQAPDLFLSVDSDVLLHPDQLANMVSCLDRFDAVGGKCYLNIRGTKDPSYALINKSTGAMRRPDFFGVIKADVIMAIKLMTPAAYTIDYGGGDRRGEDLIWSRRARAAGVRLGFDGRAVAKHVMEPDQRDAYDKRCGF